MIKCKRCKREVTAENSFNWNYRAKSSSSVSSIDMCHRCMSNFVHSLLAQQLISPAMFIKYSNAQPVRG